MSVATRRRWASVVLNCGPRCLMVADAGTVKGTCYAGGMSTVPPKFVPVPDVSLPVLELPALELGLELERVIPDSPLDYDEAIEEQCTDCGDDTSGECVTCHDPLCSECGDVCSWCDNETT